LFGRADAVSGIARALQPFELDRLAGQIGQGREKAVPDVSSYVAQIARSAP
jgi:hypothetical protein